MSESEYQLSYVPCLFELPLRKLFKEKISDKCWPHIIVWLILAVVFVAAFMGGLSSLSTKINWFTAIYFIGGLGWLPAAMCGLSHAYYEMCTKTFLYFEEPKSGLEAFYKNSANAIFGYLKKPMNVAIAVVVWFLMLLTVIMNGALFNTANDLAKNIIYACYLLVAIVFTSVVCAVPSFFAALYRLKKFTLAKHALYIGAVGQLRKNQTRCTLLIWGIIILFAMLSVAMLQSPYHQVLWIWLPPFGLVPLALFIANRSMVRSLSDTALKKEETILRQKINSALQNMSEEHRYLAVDSMIDIRDKLQEYTRNKSDFINIIAIVCAIISALGSIVAALVATMPSDMVSKLFRFWETFSPK